LPSSPVFLSPACFSLDSDSAEKLANYCNRTAAEADIGTNLYETGITTSILMQLLSGNSLEAQDHLGSELAAKIKLLNEQLKRNPCKSKEQLIARIYPVLRVVAAANAKRPIPNINGDKNAMRILAEAVADNPDHYKKLIARSKNWDHGIR
jgi:hypothetical protein